ncbi:uncharacterized protein bcl2l12 [Lampris incognitus]|uniref:uncharacterized protein bcl2l12 n=1 Tax=Lampris incognitus TaxID=2546036 RepID=UPI0024B5C642|nr:uncharacterized protein bcl2l12 [Lampris incognitus]XP_056143688.1 uncharacterized protein bcl2l12 [Lampris incognitus]
MSEAVNPASPTSDVSCTSLLEVKSDTRLVLKAFLHQSLSIPASERPGRVGGSYRDLNRYSAVPKPRPKARSGLDSQDEDVSSADERKSSFKDLIKRLPLPGTTRRSVKNLSQDHKGQNGTLENQGQPNGKEPVKDADTSVTSTSEEEDSEKRKQKKKKKFKKQISEFFRRRLEKEKNDARPQRPSSLSVPKKPEPIPTVVSPNHPPEFYVEVAEKLDKIAQRSHSIKKTCPNRQPDQPQPVPSQIKPPPDSSKEAVVQQLVQILSMEGDAINSKIQSDPFLRSTLSRLSYASFARVLDTFGNREMNEAPPLRATASDSPTLRRVAVTMEVSRRVVTATGTQRMQGYAERYMETFTPWVKNQGGWENIVDLEENLEYD